MAVHKLLQILLQAAERAAAAESSLAACKLL
jgi:hypothetical protein